MCNGLFKEDENFTQTKKLEGESGALEEFFEQLYCAKGLHVAIICADHIEKNEIEQLFAKKSSNCRKRCCVPKRAFRISNLPDKNTISSSDNKYYYQEGCYWDCISLQGVSILRVFQKIIDCLTALDKNTQNANTQLEAMYAIETAFQTSGINPCLNAQYMNELSNSILSIADTGAGYASIYILLILQESCFEIFQTDGIYFPVHIEYVVKGTVPPEEIIKELSKKVEQLSKKVEQLTKMSENTKADSKQNENRFETEKKSTPEINENSFTTKYNDKKVKENMPIYSPTKPNTIQTFKDDDNGIPMTETGLDNSKKFNSIEIQER